MKNMTLEHIAQACGGTYIGEECDRKKEIQGAVIDSRLVEEGYLFIPIRGARVDGHDFIPAVFEKGALAVLSERRLEHPAGPYILVDSTEEAMKQIAAFYRRSLDIKVVGITGAQPANQRSVQHGPLVLVSEPRKFHTPTIDRDRTVSRRSEPSSRTALMGEQPNPWDLLQPQDAMSRHRGAKPLRRCELLGVISLLSPG